MIVNNTCVPGNDTSTCLASRSTAGLAAGLTVLFLLLTIAVGVIMYIYHSGIRKKLQLGHRRSQKKEGCAKTPEADSHQHTFMSRQQSRRQTPIYENLTTQTTKNNGRTMNQSRSSGEPEEDLYLQCDLPNDAIYSNDPACTLSILSAHHEEDLYIVPDS